jgi:hypothetical protein
MLLLFSLFVLGLCQNWQMVYIFVGDTCWLDAQNTTIAYPLDFIATNLATTPCVAINCISAGGFSFKTACATSPPSIPNGMVGWGQWLGTTSCSTDPSIIAAYTTGCTTVPLTQTVNPALASFQLSCEGNDLKVTSWPSAGSCPAGGVSASVTYNFGCASVSANGQSVAFKQIGCRNGGVSIDWTAFFKIWTAWVGAWTINAFNQAANAFYQAASAWRYTFTSVGSTISVDVTFTGPTDPTVVATFVNNACSEMLQQILAGVCAQRISGASCTINANPFRQDSCIFTVIASAKRSELDSQQLPTQITISQSLSPTSSGMVSRPQFIVMLVALFVYFLKH